MSDIVNMYNRKNISISILNSSNKEEFLAKLRDICDRNHYDNIMIHFDVMDKDFVDGVGIDISLIELVKKYNFLIDVHLMCNDVKEYIDKAVSFGANNIAIHYEIDDFYNKFNYLKKVCTENGIFSSVAIKPETFDFDDDLFDDIDVCLVMSVNPGYGMQSYITSVNPKIKNISRYIKNVEVDGGVNFDTIDSAFKNGASSFVIGSYFTKDLDNLEDNIKKIMDKIKE